MTIKKFPSSNINFELETNFFVRNGLSEEKINLAIGAKPNARFSFLRIYREFLTNDDLTDASMQILLLNLFTESRFDVDIKKPQWIASLYELLNDRWNEPLSLQELSNALDIHPVTISKYFDKYFGCTLGEYLRRLRINKSISLIKNTRFSLTEIAFHCGFADQSHFTRNFKQLTGFLPKDFKKI